MEAQDRQGVEDSGKEAVRTYTIRIDWGSDEPIQSYADDGTEPLKIVDYQIVASPKPGIFMGAFVPLPEHIKERIYAKLEPRLAVVADS